MPPFNPQLHHRRSIRLKGYDYSQPGAYFVTLVTWRRECLFGEVVGEEMHVNENGRIVQACWDDLPNHYPNLTLGSFVIMPNHVHAVIIIQSDPSIHPVGAGLRPAPTTTGTASRTSPPAPTTQPGPTISPPTPTTPQSSSTIQPTFQYGLPEIVRALKSFSARRINQFNQSPGDPIWQRSFYEHIIRDDHEYHLIHLYIDSNPANWLSDEENPARKR